MTSQNEKRTLQGWVQHDVSNSFSNAIEQEIVDPLKNFAHDVEWLASGGKSKPLTQSTEKKKEAPTDFVGTATDFGAHGTVSALTYTVAGYLTQAAGRRFGTACKFGSTAMKVLDNRFTGQVIGAGIHDFYLNAQDMQGRVANAVGGATTMAVYDGTNHFLPGKYRFTKAAAQPFIGAASAVSGYYATTTVDGRTVKQEDLFRAGGEGAAFGTIFPIVTWGLGKFGSRFQGRRAGTPAEGGSHSATEAGHNAKGEGTRSAEGQHTAPENTKAQIYKGQVLPGKIEKNTLSFEGEIRKSNETSLKVGEKQSFSIERTINGNESLSTKIENLAKSQRKSVSGLEFEGKSSEPKAKNSEAKEGKGKETELKKTEAKEVEGKETELKKTEAKEGKGKETELKKTEAKEVEVKETELKKTEAKEVEVKETETKKTEAKEVEVKETELKKTEAKEVEDKRVEFEQSRDTKLEDVATVAQAETSAASEPVATNSNGVVPPQNLADSSNAAIHASNSSYKTTSAGDVSSPLSAEKVAEFESRFGVTSEPKTADKFLSKYGTQPLNVGVTGRFISYAMPLNKAGGSIVAAHSAAQNTADGQDRIFDWSEVDLFSFLQSPEEVREQEKFHRQLPDWMYDLGFRAGLYSPPNLTAGALMSPVYQGARRVRFAPSDQATTKFTRIVAPSFSQALKAAERGHGLRGPSHGVSGVLGGFDAVTVDQYQEIIGKVPALYGGSNRWPAANDDLSREVMFRRYPFLTQDGRRQSALSYSVENSENAGVGMLGSGGSMSDPTSPDPSVLSAAASQATIPAAKQ